MDHPQRFIYLALLIAWSIFRVIRYARAASAKRPGPAVPPSAGPLAPSAQGAATAGTPTTSPIEPVRKGGGFAGNILAVGVFIIGNLAIWPLLFLVPALEDVPPILRMVAGVLANFLLLQVARIVAARVAGPQSAADERNPIK